MHAEIKMIELKTNGKSLVRLMPKAMKFKIALIRVEELKIRSSN
jgi:hypothetical protein